MAVPKRGGQAWGTRLCGSPAEASPRPGAPALPTHSHPKQASKQGPGDSPETTAAGTGRPLVPGTPGVPPAVFRVEAVGKPHSTLCKAVAWERAKERRELPSSMRRGM